MKVQVLTIVEGEETEIPQGYDIFRTNFDRGICTLLLRKETKTARQPLLAEESAPPFTTGELEDDEVVGV